MICEATAVTALALGLARFPNSGSRWHKVGDLKEDSKLMVGQFNLR